jgi:NAD(P)-dependent dehydrogenase (short-subunit alcohol dehydrogenase family)
MLLDLTGRTVLVTGAGRGIGRAIASRFGAEGCDVVTLDRAFPEPLDPAPEHLLRVEADVTDAAAVERAVAAAVERFGRIDVLVNNAGILVDGAVDELDPEGWRRSFDVNVGGVFHCCRAVVPVMKRQRSGRILNAASFAAIVPSVGSAAYAASKAAVVQFTRVLASEVGPWNITANAYAPGMVPTAMNGFAELDDAAQARLLDTLSIRRWERPEDVADLLCFLASDAAGYITGTLVDVSGGKLATQIPSRAYERAEES